MKKFTIGIVSSVMPQSFKKLDPNIDRDLKLHFYDLDNHIKVLLEDHYKCDCLIFFIDQNYFIKNNKINISQANELIDHLRAFDNLGKLLILNTVFFSNKRLDAETYFKEKKKGNQINNALISLSLKSKNISLADLESTLSNVGLERAVNEKNNMVMKMPFTNHVINKINFEYERCIEERINSRKKVIIVDADNTLWGGIIGEDGTDGIKIDDEFPGIVFKKFQEELKHLKKIGYLLCMVSKNNYSDVSEAFKKVKMPLKFSDFIIKKINWDPKSQNIGEIAQELNLGLDSMIFVDDNLFELNEVSHEHNQIEAIQFNHNEPAKMSSIFHSIKDISKWSISNEDIKKTKQYLDESKRGALKTSLGSFDEYVKSLNIIITSFIKPENHVHRITQLINKTNQFNLTTKRYSEDEVSKFINLSSVYCFQVSDKFGDMGIISVAIIHNNKIDTFLMSCRALGRRIESSIISYICDKHPNIEAEFIPSKKNQQVSNFYENHCFELLGSDESGIKSYKAQKDISIIKSKALKVKEI
ncbi:MAG: HAD-IIIC family phosphatase [Gammaproteobacteria bacterium]